MVVMTNYLIVLIQHQVVHLALIHIGIVVRVVLLTLRTYSHVIWAHTLWMVLLIIDLVVRLLGPLLHVFSIIVRSF
jgi:hypothetical protein